MYGCPSIPCFLFQETYCIRNKSFVFVQRSLLHVSRFTHICLMFHFSYISHLESSSASFTFLSSKHTHHLNTFCSASLSTTIILSTIMLINNYYSHREAMVLLYDSSCIAYFNSEILTCCKVRFRSLLLILWRFDHELWGEYSFWVDCLKYG